MPAEHKPTLEQRKMVRAMCAYGIPQAEIAAVIEIDKKTLRLHYRRELDIAMPEANAKMAQTLYAKGIKGDTACMIFWLKCRARWTERIIIKESDDNVPIDPAELSDAAINERIAKLRRIADAHRNAAETQVPDESSGVLH